jgi:thioredoxin reductase
VLVCDDGHPRNEASQAIHCLLGREGITPRDLLATGKKELADYETVELRDARVISVIRADNQFAFACADGFSGNARKVLLTTGVKDVPDLEGIAALYGRSVHHCPYCDGFEYCDQPIAVYGQGDKGAEFALMMQQWSADVILFTDGAAEISSKLRERLQSQAISVCAERIARLEGGPGHSLRLIRLQSGEAITRSALFFTTGCVQRSDLWASLGCTRDEKGGIITDPLTEESSSRGVFVAGDASRDVLLVAVAIAEGAKAGVAINRALLKEDGLC